MRLNKKIYFIILFITCFALFAIFAIQDYYTVEVNDNSLVFYALKDNPEAMSYDQIIENGIRIFDYSNIEKFDWQTQIIYFKKDFLDSRNGSSTVNSKYEGGSAILKISSEYYFAWILDETVLYTGSFYKNGYSSVFQTDIYIQDSGCNSVAICHMLDTSKDSLVLDKRYNKEILDFIKKINN